MLYDLAGASWRTSVQPGGSFLLVPAVDAPADFLLTAALAATPAARAAPFFLTLFAAGLALAARLTGAAEFLAERVPDDFLAIFAAGLPLAAR